MRLPKKLRIKILQRHIKEGASGITSGNGVTSCVVAQALKERFPRRAITVAYTFAEIGKTTYYTSLNGERFIRRAVYGNKRVKPTTITLTQ